MQTYVAFLRGINVGGNSLIKMVELKEALTKAGLSDVRTYIQSGNVVFRSEIKDTAALAVLLKKTILDSFSLSVDVVAFKEQAWQQIIKNAPSWWGKDKSWKHNILILINPEDIANAVETIGELKPGMERLAVGDGALYQSVDFKMVGRATTGSKLAANPLYKKITIRNYNTATKLLMLLAS